jgi:hypothetical protein
MSAPAKPYLRVSGGTPNGFPDFVPLNPWGREFPKDLLARKPRAKVLFQVIVRDRRDGNKELRVGPKWDQREFAEMICHGIAGQVATGAERRWCDPIVVPVPSEL